MPVAGSALTAARQHVASQAGFEAAVKLLLAKGADKTVRNRCVIRDCCWMSLRASRMARAARTVSSSRTAEEVAATNAVRELLQA